MRACASRLESHIEWSLLLNAQAGLLTCRHFTMSRCILHRTGLGSYTTDKCVLARVLVSQNTHYHPAARIRLPPATGPIQGPSKGPSPQLETALPLFSDSIMSAMLPLPIVRGTTPDRPMKRRKASRDPILLLSAGPDSEPSEESFAVNVQIPSAVNLIDRGAEQRTKGKTTYRGQKRCSAGTMVVEFSHDERYARRKCGGTQRSISISINNGEGGRKRRSLE